MKTISHLLLERFNYAPDGTFGRLIMPSGKIFYTCEQPWNGNKVGASCIPEGKYQMAMRKSPVVERSSNGDFFEGWEILEVPGRTFIMIHPANWPHELRGCISVGLDYEMILNRQAVSKSREAFRQFMGETNGRQFEIDIHQFRAQFP